jgi:hypothetical protein
MIGPFSWLVATPDAYLLRDLVGQAMGVLALVGTRKGLFLLRGDEDRRRWRVEGPLPARWACTTRRSTRVLGGGRAAPAADLVGRGGGVVAVVVPNVLAAQAEGRKRFDVEAETVADALRALPVADLLFNERGDLVQHLNVYVDGTDHRETGGLECPLAGARELRVVAVVSGG